MHPLVIFAYHICTVKPIPSDPCMVCISLHLVDFYGKCREIYHTWMLWV